MKCDSACARPRSISAGVGPDADEGIDLVGDRGLEVLKRAPWRSGRDHLEEPADLPRVLRGGNLGGDPLIVDERPIESRRLAARQELGDQIHLGIAGREETLGVPGQVQPRQLDPVLEQQPHFARGRFGSRRIHRRRRFARIDRSEVALDELERIVRVERRRRATATHCAGGSRSGKRPGRPQAPRRADRRPRRSSASGTGDPADTARRPSPCAANPYGRFS